jgi:hypothetical protein
MRHVSGRRRRRQVERRKLIERMHQPESCPRCHREPCIDTHEVVRRSQCSTAETDLDLMVPLGRSCHDWIGRHPTEAHDEGWGLWRYELADAEAIRRAEWRRLEASLTVGGAS